MKVVIASGKGGTGKTMVAVSLALGLDSDSVNMPPLFIDCDVEAPDAHLFLNPDLKAHEDIGILIPSVDETKCTYCGKCAEVCQYHAIAVLGKNVLVFPQLCHGCGSCMWVCPENAVREVLNVTGVLESGVARHNIPFTRGMMNIGEPMAVPVIRQLKKWSMVQPDRVVILDAPPGSSCPVVEAMRGADFSLLVTEPTPFGLHDLKLAVQVSKELNIPAGIIINRDLPGDTGVEEYCMAENLPILMRIPFQRNIAEGIARGKALVDIQPEYMQQFQQLFKKIGNILDRK